MPDEADPTPSPEVDEPPPPRRSITTYVIAAVLLIGVVIGAALLLLKLAGFPADTKPEGAYLRVASSLSKGDVRSVFPYLEDEAQHACFSVWHYRKDAYELVERTYPEPERTRLMNEYRAHASAADGADVWVDLATKRAYASRLRRDLSGVSKVEIQGERATIETARGSRYAFRRRDNGMWGLTMFTAEILGDAERASRDFDVVKRAAEDYERGR